MRKIITFLLLTTAVVLLAGESKPTAGQVIERYIEAIGGKKNLEALQTIYIKRELIHTEAGTTKANYSYQKRPNMRRFGAGDAKTFLATDGKKAWRVMPDPASGKSKWNELPARFAASMVQDADFYRFIGPFIDYRKKGMTVEFIGTETMDDLRLHRLKITPAIGKPRDYYFNAAGGLLVRYKPNEATNVTIEDYRKVGGILLAHRTTGIGTSPRGPFKHINKVVEVRLNIALEDTLFMPSSD